MFYVINKKWLIFFILGIVVLSIVIGCAIAIPLSAKTTSATKKEFSVVLDAGHGGVDGGAVGINTKTLESNLNLKVTLKVKELLNASGINVVLTREDENGLYGSTTDGFKRRDMQKRKEIIEKAKPNAVVSIHMNKCSYNYRQGAQVFFHKGSENSTALANEIQASLNNTVNFDRDYLALKGDYYLINCTEFTTVIVECGFLSNVSEEKLLLLDSHQTKLASAIASGIISYLAKTTSYAQILEGEEAIW